jgi:hypothetical protein
MTRPPSHLWSAVEDAVGLEARIGEWKRLLGDEWPAAENLLLPTGRVLSTFPCPRPGGDGCPRRIVEIDGGFEAICGERPRKCESIRLAAADLVILKLDIETFCRGVSGVLGVNHFSFSPAGIPLTWCLGGFGPNAAEALPVYLTIPTGREGLRRVVADLMSLAEGPLLLLTPTSKMATLPTVDLLRRRRSAYAALDDLLDFLPDGRFEAVKTLAQLSLPSDQAKPAGPASTRKGGVPEASENIFRRTGNFWVLAYRGKTVHLRHSRGLWLMSQLLRSPGQAIPASELESLEHGRKIPERLDCAGEVADAKALGAYRAKAAEIATELREAASFNDVGRTSRLRDELEFIDSHLRAATGLHGRQKRVGAGAERARKAASNSVSRAVEAIRRVHPELAEHLAGTLRLGQELEYRPTVPVVWAG